MKVGRCVDEMTSTNADFARELHKTLVLVRTPSPDRLGPADLSWLLNEEAGTLPAWSSKSTGFEERLAEARDRAGSKTTYRPFDFGELRGDDGEKIEIPEGKTEFEVLRELYTRDEPIGKARAWLGPEQKGQTLDELWRPRLRREDRRRQKPKRARESTAIGGASAAVRREITSLCHEMTEAVDLLVSPQLARQEIRVLCHSMTEEVDAAAAPQLGRSLKRVARADFENWLADRKTRWRAERGYEYKTNAPRPGRELNEAELAALKEEWAREQAAADGEE